MSERNPETESVTATLSQNTSLLKKRARHPIIFGTIDMTLSGGMVVGAATNIVNNILDFSYRMQESSHIIISSRPPSPIEINNGLCIEAIATVALYSIYYYTDLRLSSPATIFRGVRRIASEASKRLKRKDK